MTRHAINATGAALELGDLSSQELDAVSGGFFYIPLLATKVVISGGQEGEGTGGCSNDPCAQFQQIMQTLTQG
jgi:hypothetical protein